MALNRGKFMEFILKNKDTWFKYTAITPDHKYENYGIYYGGFLCHSGDT